jgi:hypothetical protein
MQEEALVRSNAPALLPALAPDSLLGSIGCVQVTNWRNARCSRLALILIEARIPFSDRLIV